MAGYQAVIRKVRINDWSDKVGLVNMCFPSKQIRAYLCIHLLHNYIIVTLRWMQIRIVTPRGATKSSYVTRYQ